MGLRVSRALLAAILVAAVAGLASAWRIFSSPSEIHAQVAFGLSGVRLVSALLLLVVAALLSLAGWFVWRNPFRTAVWVRAYLGTTGWMRLLLTFSSAETLLITSGLHWYGVQLGLNSMVALRLQPGLAWAMVVSGGVAVFLSALPFLEDPPAAGESQALARSDTIADPAPTANSVGRDVVVGSLVLVLAATFIAVVCLHVKATVRDWADPAALSAMPPSVAREVRPEQSERTAFIASALFYPIVCFLLWSLAGTMQKSFSMSTRRAGTLVLIGWAVCLAGWLYAAMDRVGFSYLRVLYPDLELSVPISLFLPFLVLLYLEGRYAAAGWARWMGRILTVAAGTAVVASTLSVTLLTRADPFAYSMHFNAYFYSVVQVFFGKTLLVDLTNLYGFYPYFLQPVLGIIGMDVPQMTLVMGVLLSGCFLIVLFLLTRLAKSRLIAACGVLAVAGYYTVSAAFSLDPYFQYFPHRVVLPTLLLLLVYLYQRSRGRRKRALYYLGFMSCAAGLLWNVETGVIGLAAYLIFLEWETLGRARATGPSRTALALIVHVAWACAAVLAAGAWLAVYTFARSGQLIDWAAIGTYQTLFYGVGLNMLPMPLLHPWNLVILAYMAGLTVSALCLHRRLRGEPTELDESARSWFNMVFFLSVLGIGLFVVYQGRSDDANLVATFWTTFLLTALYADALFERAFRDRGAPRPGERTGPWGWAFRPAAAVILFVLFLVATASIKMFPAQLAHLRRQVSMLTNAGAEMPKDVARKEAFLISHFAPGTATPIFSSQYETVFHLLTRTTNPVAAPGWNEQLFNADAERYARSLQTGEFQSIVSTGTFAFEFPEIMEIIRANYVEGVSEGELTLFVWRPR